MGERHWHYLTENGRVGPVPESRLKEMLDAGALRPQTLVWSDLLAEWTPASKIRFSGHETVVVLKDPPEPPIDLSPEPAQTTHASDIPQVRPWIRFWARQIDITLASLNMGFLFGGLVFLGIIPAPLVQPILNFATNLSPRFSDILSIMLTVLVWIPIEASLLSRWGTTPGKWLLNITLRDPEGRKLIFPAAFKRGVWVWWRGMGAGFPIVSFFTLCAAFGDLTSAEGKTTWDRDGGFVISHGKIGFLRGALLTAFVVFFFVSTVVTIGQSFKGD
ncbi:MAG: RDD family protein [Nitrospirae bacterium]|nr:RDD family protein [Nitrospirota bacterium]